MTAANLKSTTIRSVPVSKLAVSPHNVRRSATSATDDAELKASILANGVGQNLIVHSRREGGKETFLVAAGGRRLRALEALLAEGRIKDTFEVPVRVVSAKDAEEISLAENAVRVAMHPADEFEAFARLIEGGATMEQVATRFGTSPINVERRMKLGRLHPDLLALYREGGMTLEACKALTITSDHDRQWKAWEATENERRYDRNGIHHMIRRLLTSDGVRSTTKIGKLVDHAAYEAAGGTLSRDLFGSSDGAGIELTFEDTALAEKFALEALEAHAAPLRDEWKWVEVALEPEPHRQGWSRLREVQLEAPEDLSAEAERIGARVAELEDWEDEDSWTDEMTEELDELYEKRGALADQLYEYRGFTAEQKAASGVIVGPGHDGPVFAYGILNPGDIAAIEDSNRAARAAAEAATATEADTSLATSEEAEGHGGSRKDEDVDIVPPSVAPLVPDILPGQPAGISRTAEAIENGEIEREAKDAPIHSQSLDLDLRQARRQVLAAHLAGDFGASFDMLLWQMAMGILTAYCASGSPLECRFTVERNAAGSAPLDDTAASALLAAHRDALNLTFIDEKDPAASFAMLCALPDDDKQALFAFCVSTMLVRQSTPVIEAVGSRLGVDVAAFWRPTAETYWGRVKKDVCLDAARETLGHDWTSNHKDQKKAVLAQSMERVFADGKGISLTADEIAAAKAWLPDGMAFAIVDAAVGDTSPASDEPTDGDSVPVSVENAQGAEVIEVPAFLRGAA